MGSGDVYKRQGLGGTVRLEGQAASHASVPRNHFGLDVLRTARPFLPIRRPGDVHFEIEGDLIPTPAGPYWKVHDQETLLSFKRKLGSWFLGTASGGLLAGSAELLGAHTHRFPGGWATVLVLAEISELGLGLEQQGARTLDDWRRRLGSSLAKQLEALDGQALARRAGAIPGGRQAALVDQVIGSVALGGVDLSAQLASLRTLFGTENLGVLSDGFFERGPSTGVTRAQASLDYWAQLAKTSADQDPAESLQALPLPGSASSRRARGLGWKKWIAMAYLAVGLGALAWWRRSTSDDPNRVTNLAVLLLMGCLTLDATLIPELGAFPTAPLGCLFMALASFGFRRWTRGWGSLCAGLFLLASLHELWALTHPGPRIILMLGFGAMGGVGYRISARPSLLWWLGAGVLIPALAAVLILGDLPRPWFLPVYVLQSALGLLLPFSILIAAARRTTEETQAS